MSETAVIYQGGNTPIPIKPKGYDQISEITNASAMIYVDGYILHKWSYADMIFHADAIVLPLSSMETQAFHSGPGLLEFKWLTPDTSVYFAENFPIIIKCKRDDTILTEEKSEELFMPTIELDIVTSKESSYELPQATLTTLGGVKAKPRTDEVSEVAIDEATGLLYASGLTVVEFLPDDLIDGGIDITHNKNSINIIASIYNGVNQQIIPDIVSIIDNNIIHLHFDNPELLGGICRVVVFG